MLSSIDVRFALKSNSYLINSDCLIHLHLLFFLSFFFLFLCVSLFLFDSHLLTSLIIQRWMLFLVFTLSARYDRPFNVTSIFVKSVTVAWLPYSISCYCYTRISIDIDQISLLQWNHPMILSLCTVLPCVTRYFTALVSRERNCRIERTCPTLRSLPISRRTYYYLYLIRVLC